MAVYSVEGKLGTGKTKFAVWIAQQALYDGRRVASNVDLALEKLVPYKRNPQYVRVPDKPKAFDLEAVGHGNPDSYDEDRNGVLILDELGTWLNSRSFQDKDRAPMLDWLIHARKHGWDVYLIVQDAGMIDKQVREALIEYQVRLFRGDKIKIPIIGHILGVFNKRWGYLPKFHLATARVGYGANAVMAERWWFKGLDLHAAYDTRQIFTPDYDRGSFSALPPPDYVPLVPPFAWLYGAPAKVVSMLRAWASLEPRKRPSLPPKPKPLAVQLIMKIPDLDERMRLMHLWLNASKRAADALRKRDLARQLPMYRPDLRPVSMRHVA